MSETIVSTNVHHTNGKHFGMCQGCHRERKIMHQARQLCQTCRTKAYARYGTCTCCQRKDVFIMGRELCRACYQRDRKAGEFTEDGREGLRRQLTPVELAAAKAREVDYINRILPAVTDVARRKFWRCGQQNRLEMTAEAIAPSWQHFARLVADGYEPLDYIGLITKHATRQTKKGHGVAGSHSTMDVTSPFCRVAHGVRVNCYDDHTDHRRVRPSFYLLKGADVEHLRRRAISWFRRLPEAERQVAKHLLRGYSTKETARLIGLHATTVRAMCRRFTTQWQQLLGDA